MPAAPASAAQRHLAQRARRQFVEGICAGLAELDRALLDALTELMDQTATVREMQLHRDAWMQYQQRHADWAGRTAKSWREALTPPGANHCGGGPLELLGDDVVENKLLAARMALAVSEPLGAALDHLRRCHLALEGREPGGQDILRPETVCLRLIEQWGEAGLSRSDLQLVSAPLQRELTRLLQKHYQALTAFYAAQGVKPRSDFKPRLRQRSGDGAGGDTAPAHPGAQAQTPFRGAYPQPTGFGAGMPAAYGPGMPAHFGAGMPAGFAPGMSAAAQGPGMPAHFGAGIPTMARARQRAHEVMRQLHQVLALPAAGFDPNAQPASAALAQAISAQLAQAGEQAFVFTGHQPVTVRLVGALREQSSELKKKAETTAEKAIIEVVALMFQSILAEERIAPAVRVWFARLQVPVLRVALAETEFFSNLEHPARKLIDRMGACAMGFDATAVGGKALALEIGRVVQVIEQYPETGSRVFQLVYDEFVAFLSRFLIEKQSTARLVSVAQQVEEKETLTIQYTIELRNMLRDMPVREEIREFLFKTWAEALALAAMRDGAQHAQTVALKRVAADLVWAASTKPQRSDRAQVIARLPALLQGLRHGLGLLGVQGAEQDARIRALTDTLADAFQSKTASIPQAHIDAMAARLARLEDFLSDATLGAMPLSADSIELMLGIDASAIHVIADKGAVVDEAMLAWAQALQAGVWYTLDHNGVATQVQYIWQSQRQQLHLFAAVDGSNFLLQLRRLAAYLQAGLLVPQDAEGLTLRATRDALAKLDANPERLLG